MQPRRRGRDTTFVTPRLAYGFVALVGGSSGLIAGAEGATLAAVAGLSVFGLVVGVGLLLAIGIFPWTGE